MFRKSRLVCAAASLVIVWGCGGSAHSDPPPGAEVTITTPDGEVITGQLTPASTPQAGAPNVTDASPPADESEPAFAEVTIPAGTTLSVVLETALASDVSQVEDPVQARVDQTVIVGGKRAVPEGSLLRGTVTSAAPSGKVKGRAQLAYRFNQLDVESDRYEVRSETLWHEAKSTKTSDAKKIGIGAGAGALVGGLLGGKKGAGAGAAIGGGGVTAMVLTSAGDEVELRPGHRVDVKLQDPVVVLVPLG